MRALNLTTLFVLLAAFAVGPLPAGATPAAPAAGFVVNSHADAPDANLSNPACQTATLGECTLRAAIQQANATAGLDAITFGVLGTIVLTGPSPVITDAVSLVGPGAALLAIDAADLGSVLSFIAAAPASFYLEGLTLQGGAASQGGGVYLSGSAPLVISATVLTGNWAGLSGGGLRLNDPSGSVQLINSAVLTNTSGTRGGGVSSSGDLEIINSRIEDNLVAPVIVAAAGAPEPQGGELNNIGGGLYTTGPLTLTDSLVLGNSVTEPICAAAAAPPSGGGCTYGAGVAVAGPRALVRGSTLAGNYFTPPGLAGATPAGGLMGYGGGLYNDFGLVVVRDSVVDDNSAYIGGGLYNVGGDLGLLRTRVSDNTAGFAGGGLFSEDGPLAVIDSLFFDNNANKGSGGGLYFYNGALVVRNTEFDRNGATLGGGGLVVADALALIEDAAVHHNAAGSPPFAGGAALAPQGGAGEGGGLLLIQSIVVLRQSAIYSNTADAGGGLANSGTLTMTNVTLSGNSATGNGGGLYLSLPPAANSVAGLGPVIRAYLHHVTVAGNLADSDSLIGGQGGGIFVSVNLTATFSSSLVALNVDTGGEAPACGGAGGYVSAGYNLWDVTTNCDITAATGDQFNVASGLLPLQNNGGGTPTHGLAFGSLALDTADPANCLPQDQRGVPRPSGPGCDIGAFELAGIYIPLVLK